MAQHNPLPEALEDLMDLVRDAPDDVAREAYEVLCARYRPRLVNALLRYCNWRLEDAEDVAQSAWQAVWERRGTWDRTKGAGFWAWLWTIARHELADLGPKPPRPMTDDTASPPSPDIPWERLQIIAEACVTLLRRREPLVQAIVRLRFFDPRYYTERVQQLVKFAEQRQAPEVAELAQALADHLGQCEENARELDRLSRNMEISPRPTPHLAESMCEGLCEPPRTYREVGERTGRAIATVCEICQEFLGDLRQYVKNAF